MKTPTWSCGTPKSINNCFSAHKDGTPSIFAADKENKVWKDGKTQSQYQTDLNIAKREAKEAHLLAMRPTRTDKILANRHGGVYSKAVA
jgi:hypothetical protein